MISELVSMITEQLVHWEADGTGVRIIIVGTSEGTDNKVGYKPDLFDRDPEHVVKYGVCWLKEHGLKLVRTIRGETCVDTKFSRLLGQPSGIVAGMTPCTVPSGFVVATRNVGY
ncbi:hypothetical protein HOY80DRAFT_1032120 [Tuber brumale]|nr:hypothetical protein HOY80DRAFT_1032120 [Tuber brumale]